MSTFSKLSLVAQYDDMCRLVNKLIKDTAEEEEASIAQLEALQKRWTGREEAHEKEKLGLKSEISSLQREIKKLNRQLAESRTALVREAEDKKIVARERKALLDQIKQVRLLVESKDGLGNTDAHRKRVIKCLDVERLSPIHSQSDDSDDCVSGLDYDRTEEDILDTVERSRRSNRFDDALENMPGNEQPTLLYRYYDNGSDNNNQLQEEPRRSSRSRSGATTKERSSSSHRSSQSAAAAAVMAALKSDKREKYHNLAPETDTDDGGIEYVRQELKKYETEKKEALASTISTPNIKNQNRGATLSAKSAANLKKTISNVSTPVQNVLKLHTFSSKKSFKPDTCAPCGGKISFYGSVVKCETCGVICHPDCQDKCPLPCVKMVVPNTKSRLKKILISDYVNSDAVPKVPALIVHCCNEIERGDNINTVGLYRVAAHTTEIEDLQQKILKSKSGMPNLSKLDVNLLTGVVKRFLQSLDESLVTTTLWSHFAEAVKLDSFIETRTHIIYYISYDLPTANRDTLAYLMQHLHAIAKHSDKNMMTTKNLAKTLAPTIIGNSCRNPPNDTIQQENKTQIKIMETLFEIEEDFWSQFVQKTPSTQVNTLGSRLLGTPSASSGIKTRGGSRLAGATLPTPKLKPLFS